jgi:hypothetical protein|nr:MAG TPA: hypothetical protein [Caudoviricetes sp.]
MKTQIEKIKQFMETNQYFIGNDLLDYMKSAEKEIETEIKMAYSFGENKQLKSADEYYDHMYGKIK